MSSTCSVSMSVITVITVITEVLATDPAGRKAQLSNFDKLHPLLYSACKALFLLPEHAQI